jgi:hypothetical protein
MAIDDPPRWAVAVPGPTRAPGCTFPLGHDAGEGRRNPQVTFDVANRVECLSRRLDGLLSRRDLCLIPFDRLLRHNEIVAGDNAGPWRRPLSTGRTCSRRPPISIGQTRAGPPPLAASTALQPAAATSSGASRTAIDSPGRT